MFSKFFSYNFEYYQIQLLILQEHTYRQITENMEKGIALTLKMAVTPDKSAASMGSGTLDVLATPAMIALIEETAWRSVASFLDPGQATVGTNLQIKHLAPTPLGMDIRCETVLVAVEGRKLTFEANVYDDGGLIGSGTHERFVIDADRFQAKANSKSDTSKKSV